LLANKVQVFTPKVEVVVELLSGLMDNRASRSSLLVAVVVMER
jgi:hypothetical protein